MSSTLTEKVYIVTGGSRGFGLAIAKQLVAAGAKVGLLSRKPDELDKAVQELGTDVAIGVATDVASRADVNAAFDKVVQRYGRLDGLINNAGVARPSSVENLQEDEVLLQINTNFLGTVLCCQAAIPFLRRADNARIINISSASAWHYDEMLHLSVYAASKAAVERFTRDLRTELQADAIGVSCVRPGGAWTGIADDWDEDALKAGLTAWKKTGPTMDSGMSVEHVAEAVVSVLEYPAGVAVDLLEIRPNQPIPKLEL
jgi:NAD(P)-dependent dehydrogenase (short-subunit alcohol dehydrogenase family)